MLIGTLLTIVAYLSDRATLARADENAGERLRLAIVDGRDA